MIKYKCIHIIIESYTYVRTLMLLKLRLKVKFKEKYFEL